MSDERHLYRPAEAAASLGISRARLYQLLSTGEIASVKIGVSRRIPAVDLEAFVTRLRAEQNADARRQPVRASLGMTP